MARTLALGFGIGALMLTTGCWHAHAHAEAERNAFAQRVADRCVEAARAAQPAQVIVVPGGVVSQPPSSGQPAPR